MKFTDMPLKKRKIPIAPSYTVVVGIHRINSGEKLEFPTNCKMPMRLQAAANTRVVFFEIIDKPRQLLGPCQMHRTAAGTSRKQLFFLATTTHTCGWQGTRVPRRLGADRSSRRSAMACRQELIYSPKGKKIIS